MANRPGFWCLSSARTSRSDPLDQRDVCLSVMCLDLPLSQATGNSLMTPYSALYQRKLIASKKMTSKNAPLKRDTREICKRSAGSLILLRDEKQWSTAYIIRVWMVGLSWRWAVHATRPQVRQESWRTKFQPYSTSPERGAWTAAVEALIIAGSKPNKIP